MGRGGGVRSSPGRKGIKSERATGRNGSWDFGLGSTLVGGTVVEIRGSIGIGGGASAGGGGTSSSGLK